MSGGKAVIDEHNAKQAKAKQTVDVLFRMIKA
jgi:hypothetical protein